MNAFYRLHFDIIDDKDDIYGPTYWNKILQNPNVMFFIEDNIHKIDWKKLSKNPSAIHILKDNLNKIDWENMSHNTNIFKLFENNQKLLKKMVRNSFDVLSWNSMNWRYLSSNPGAIPILEDNKSVISWDLLSENPKAIHLLEANLIRISWSSLCLNPNAIHIIEANLNRISWTLLSSNPNAIYLLEANLDKVCWKRLSGNPKAIHILEANPDKICWNELSRNPNAMHLLEANPDKVNMVFLSCNSNIKAIDMLRNLKQANINLNSFEKFQNFYFNVKNIDIMNKTIETLNLSEKIEFILFCSGSEGCEHGSLLLNPNILSLLLEWDYSRIRAHFYNSYGKELIEWIYNPKNFNKWNKTCWDLDIDLSIDLDINLDI